MTRQQKALQLSQICTEQDQKTEQDRKSEFARLYAENQALHRTCDAHEKYEERLIALCDRLFSLVNLLEKVRS